MLDEPSVFAGTGDECPLPASSRRLPGRAFMTVGGDTVMLRFFDEGSEIIECSVEGAALLADDYRVLPPAVEAGTLAEADLWMADFNADDAAWFTLFLSGPGTANTWASEAVRQGLGSLITRHERWLADSGVNRASAAAYEHDALSRSLQYGLNMGPVHCMEVLARRLRLIEEAVSEDLSNPSFKRGQYYKKVALREGVSCMVPSLHQYVALELAKAVERRESEEAGG